MSQDILTPPPQAIDYPDSDGKPMADNTVQFRWIVTLEGGLEVLFAGQPDVFVAGDLLWYPVLGSAVCQAPDAMVVFGRPKGDRGSYKQWEEGNIAPQVVFEVLSPGNFQPEMDRKFDFYEKHGVEEYYLYDPDRVELCGWRRKGKRLQVIPQMNGWTSPLLKIRFQIENDTLRILGPDGQPFLTYREQAEQREQEKRLRKAAERKQKSAERETARLRAKMKAAGLDPDA